MLGLGQAQVSGELVSGKEALSRAGIHPLVLQAKEGLALLNGTQVMAALGTLQLARAEVCTRSADIIGALSAEALSSNHEPFDARIHQIRGQTGQITAASNLRALLDGSEIIRQRPIRRVQEAYCIRCLPQVHGAARDMVTFVRSIFEREINAVTDNPLVFSEDEDVLSGGNFHGQPISLALDGLGMAMATLGGISERRIARLMDKEASGLPGFLASKEGVHSGFMIAQITAAALASENKTHAHPASVDSIPTSANQEDYVSMGMHAALKGSQILRNTETILAIELLASCQGVELRRPLGTSPALEAVIQAFRKAVSSLTEDRVLSPDVDAAKAFIKDEKLIEAVSNIIDIK
jgi:histidine ammonia-lyase